MPVSKKHSLRHGLRMPSHRWQPLAGILAFHQWEGEVLLGLSSLPPPPAKLRSHRIWRDSSPQPQGQFLPGRGTQPGGQRTPGPGETKALGQLCHKGHKGAQTSGVGCLRIVGKLPAYQALRIYKATAQSFPGRRQ